MSGEFLSEVPSGAKARTGFAAIFDRLMPGLNTLLQSRARLFSCALSVRSHQESSSQSASFTDVPEKSEGESGGAAKIPGNFRCPYPRSQRLYCDCIQRVGLPIYGTRPERGSGRRSVANRGCCPIHQETRHNLPWPFTIHQGFHPNPALLGNDQPGGARLTRMKE
jgi:hypothetical protein